MAVSFNAIPADIRVPLTYIEFDNSGAVSGTPVMEWRVLLLGQAEADCAGELLKPVLMNTADQAARLWGQGSQIADMVRYAKRNSTMLEIWAMAVPDDASAVAATGDVTLSGQCTATGVLCLYVGGRRVRVQAVDCSPWPGRPASPWKISRPVLTVWAPRAWLMSRLWLPSGPSIRPWLSPGPVLTSWPVP